MLLAGALALPAGGVPIQKLLGQQPLPKVVKNDRFQEGFVRVGHFLKNDERAVGARPDGSGSAYNLYQIYIVDALKGEKSNFLADMFFLSDHDRGDKFNLSSYDYLLGLAFKGPEWNLQFNREEGMPIDRGGVGFRYWDARLSTSQTTGEQKKSLGRIPIYARPKRSPIIAKWTAMIGYFLHNNTYMARTDGTDPAQLRYQARGELIHASKKIKLVGEADFLTGQHKAFKPLSVQVSYGFALSSYGAEVAILREFRENLDGPGFFPSYMLRMTYAFDTRGRKR